MSRFIAIDTSENLDFFQVTDEMRRESAIADDYWYQVFQSNLTDRTQLVLQKIEHK